MDFLKEFEKFIKNQPIQLELKNKIIAYTTRLRKDEYITLPKLETLVSNIIECCEKDVDINLKRSYITYILNKARELK